MTFNEYKERLEKARATLAAMRDAAAKDLFGIHEETRLAGKLEGVTLALSYLREYERDREL